MCVCPPEGSHSISFSLSLSLWALVTGSTATATGFSSVGVHKVLIFPPSSSRPCLCVTDERVAAARWSLRGGANTCMVRDAHYCFYSILQSMWPFIFCSPSNPLMSRCSAWTKDGMKLTVWSYPSSLLNSDIATETLRVSRGCSRSGRAHSQTDVFVLHNIAHQA